MSKFDILKGIRTQTKVKFFLTGLVVIFLAISLQTSVTWIEPTDLGLASNLPLSYWIGVCLLGILWYVGRKSRFCLVAALILSFSYLYVGPAIIRATPWISNSYYPFGESLLINQSGHLIDRPALFVSYLDWPIFLYLASALTLVTGAPHDLLIRFFPLFIVALYGLFSVLILRTKMKLSFALVGAAWVLGSFFIRQQYFGPQAIAYVFFLFILLLSTWIFFDDRRNKRVLIALLVFLCFITIFTHPLTSLMPIFIISAIFLSYRFVVRKTSSFLVPLGMWLLAVWLFYNMTIARPFMKTTIEHMSGILSGERELNLYSESSRIVGSQAMQLNFMASWAIVFFGAGICILSIFLLIRTLRRNRKDSSLGFSFFMVFLLVLLGLFGFAGEYGAHESYQRAFMFALVPVSYLCVTFLAKKPKILMVCLVALLFLNIPAQYGGDTYRLATKTQLAGSKFIADNFGQDVTMIGKFNLYIRYYDPLKNIEVFSIGLSFPFTDYNSSAVEEAIDQALTKVDFIISSDIQTNYYEYFLGLDPLEQVEFEDKCNLIYNNGRFRLYVPLNRTIQP